MSEEPVKHRKLIPSIQELEEQIAYHRDEIQILSAHLRVARRQAERATKASQSPMLPLKDPDDDEEVIEDDDGSEL